MIIHKVDEVLDHIEHILDYYTDSSNKDKDRIMLTNGSTILEGLVSEDPFIVYKAMTAAKLYIEKFNNSNEVH